MTDADIRNATREDLVMWDGFNQHDYGQALISHDVDAIARINDNDTILKREIIRRAEERA